VVNLEAKSKEVQWKASNARVLLLTDSA
jgi:hypothetical protein